ncbi:hypothetical protein [Aminirod propionatiphilus]|uniref:Glycosyltransferase n=1 Tax=Aminirod propionatiphilus TaxID=3415223 RepID=A0ACD1DUG8_9BACT|nr:glycosyltransferase [Synergistota bacterium]
MLSHLGGVETWLSYFIPEITNYYNDITIYHVKNTFESENNINLPCKCIPTSPPKGIMFLLKTTPILRSQICQGDIIISIGTFLEALVGYLASFMKKDIINIVWIRTITYSNKKNQFGRLGSYLIKNIEKFLLNKATIVISNGQDTLSHYRDILGIKRTINVINNASPRIDLTYLPFSDYQPKSRKLHVAYLGRYHPAKGYSVFVKLSSDKHLCSEVEFKSWGWGSWTNEENSSINQGPFKPKDLINIFAWSDCVVFLNRNTGNSLAGGVSHGLIEAMLAGRLIVAWNNTTHSQCIGPEDSFLIKENSCSDFKKTLLSITKDGIDLKKCQAVRKKAIEQFSVKVHVDKFINLIKNN